MKALCPLYFGSSVKFLSEGMSPLPLKNLVFLPTLSVPSFYLQQIPEMGLCRRMSISNLCSRWPMT